jgi:hypothetical protein
VSTAWSNDEGIGMFAVSLAYGGQELNGVTVQNSLIAAGLRPHSAGLLLGGDADEPDVFDISIHHNVFVHNSHRNPMIKRAKQVQVINNVVYNWRNRVGYTLGEVRVDYIGNYWKAGPWSQTGTILGHQIIEKTPEYRLDPLALHIAENTVVLPGSAPATPPAPQTGLTQYTWDKSGPLPNNVFVSAPVSSPTIPVTLQAAADAYTGLLDSVGASARIACDGSWVPNRDALDKRFITHIQSDTGPSTDEENDHQDDYGGFPVLAAGSGCSDQDGTACRMNSKCALASILRMQVTPEGTRMGTVT